MADSGIFDELAGYGFNVTRGVISSMLVEAAPPVRRKGSKGGLRRVACQGLLPR
jgi:hypothetical protein